MKIMVSACLTGENCKYNGGNNRSEKILQLMASESVLPPLHDHTVTDTGCTSGK